MAVKKGLGELLVRENLIGIEELEQARKSQKNHGGRLMTSLVKLGYVKETELSDFLGRQYNLPTIDLNSFDIPSDVISLISKQVCEKHCVIPVSKAARTLVVAFSDPSNIFVKDDLSLLTRCKIEVVVAPESSINAAIDKYYGGEQTKMSSLMSEIEDEEVLEASTALPGAIDDDPGSKEAPIIRFVNAMLAEAIKLKASDIHIEPYEKRFRIRFRIDGVLFEKTQPPPGTKNAIVSRIKILCRMDIAERRKPQDGRLKVKLKNGMDIDFRVNALPVLYGEKVVLRLLDKSNLEVDLKKLGFEDAQMELFQTAIYQPQGMVLVTGPTGSGKTTTLYSAISELNKPTRNVSTAEDPVEFNLDGINQVQVNPEIGFTFAEALRAFLRQDPEVIMLGEIRDYETAEIAYKAASTGHMVVSTLHTNDAASTVTRLLEMGIEPYIVAEATSLIIAQRLIKKVCSNCIIGHRVPHDVLIKLGVAKDQLNSFNELKKGEGCAKCNGTGLSGRAAIFEVMKVTTNISDMIFKKPSPLEIKKQAIEKDGMLTLRQHALVKLRQGLTTVEEVINTTIADEI